MLSAKSRSCPFPIPFTIFDYGFIALFIAYDCPLIKHPLFDTTSLFSFLFSIISFGLHGTRDTKFVFQYWVGSSTQSKFTSVFYLDGQCHNILHYKSNKEIVDSLTHSLEHHSAAGTTLRWQLFRSLLFSSYSSSSHLLQLPPLRLQTREPALIGLHPFLAMVLCLLVQLDIKFSEMSKTLALQAMVHLLLPGLLIVLSRKLGTTDDTASINSAIAFGTRCGQGWYVLFLYCIAAFFL